MGLLDDAIREHLELKRKHGAAEDDLRRQESEALGPARRDFVAADAAVDEPIPAEADPLPEPQLEDELAEEPAGWLDDDLDVPEDLGPPDDSRAPEDIAAPSHLDAPEEPLEHAAEAADPLSGQEPLATPDPTAPVREETAALERDVPPPPPRVPVEDELAAADLAPDPEAADEDEEEGEDVLEETPDFLQDTPEHDRLWFEQKPPRDFDFDA